MILLTEINPIDYIYHALKMQLQLLDEKDPMLQIIMRYVYNTSETFSSPNRNRSWSARLEVFQKRVL